MSEFAANLKQFRKRKNYSQATLARKLNYGHTITSQNPFYNILEQIVQNINRTNRSIYSKNGDENDL